MESTSPTASASAAGTFAAQPFGLVLLGAPHTKDRHRRDAGPNRCTTRYDDFPGSDHVAATVI
jgi:hypothetical protein